jgi:hypothetical protein
MIVRNTTVIVDGDGSDVVGSRVDSLSTLGLTTSAAGGDTVLPCVRPA